MKKINCLVLFLLVSIISSAQNLVPNGGFEQYTHCPNDISQLDSALFWTNPSTNILSSSGTPDYFNQCTNLVLGTLIGVPNNFNGFQQTHGGNAYAGAYLWSSITNFREYFETQLNSSLIPNICYHFQMFINLANKTQYTIDSIGCYFSDTLISNVNDFYPLPFNAQITCAAGNLLDTLNWVMLSGDYTATGGESYLIIGNFDSDSNTVVTLINSTAPVDAVYVYIDDVSLTPCNVGVDENNNNTSINIYPNPVANQLNITTTCNQPLELTLYDIATRKLLQQSFTGAVSLNTSQLANGIYFYQLTNKNGIVKTGKIVKE